MASTTRPEGRPPIARHGVLGTRHPLLTILAIFGVVVAVLSVSGLGVGAFAVWNAAQSVSDNAVVFARG